MNILDLYGFTFATGDINYLDYGGTWIRQAGEREYHFIRLINWEDAVGEREAREIGERYNMGLGVVNLALMAPARLADALRSCGQQNETDERWIALACFEYGARAPMEDTDTSNFHKTFRWLASRSRAMQRDASVKEHMMNRPVNKLGSTAEEYMRGDLDSAIARGLEQGDQNARIVAKMYGML